MNFKFGSQHKEVCGGATLENSENLKCDLVHFDKNHNL